MRAQTGDAQRELQGSPERGTEGVLGWGWGRGGATEGKRLGGDKGVGLTQGCLFPSPLSPHNLCYIVELALLELQPIAGILS